MSRHAYNAQCSDCRSDFRRVEQLARDLVRDDQPAPKPWRVLYLEHVPMLLEEIKQLREASR